MRQLEHLSIQYCYLFLKLKILPRWQTIVPRGDRHSPKRQNANYYLKELETQKHRWKKQYIYMESTLKSETAFAETIPW